ncbi:MAG TPA: hypothetical protein VIB00_06630, partial [Pyrinomonadaceae bacterium]
LFITKLLSGVDWKERLTARYEPWQETVKIEGRRGGGRRSEVRDQKSEIRSRKSEVFFVDRRLANLRVLKWIDL